MSDSETKDTTQADFSNPSGVTTLVVRNTIGKDGKVTVREQKKDKNGRWMAKSLPSTMEYVRDRRKRLSRIRQGTGRHDGIQENLSIIEELLDFIHMEIAVDAKTGLPDAKHMMAKVKAAELILLYTEGKPSPSEQEMDKLQTQPVRVIMVTAPQLMHPEIQEEKKTEIKTKPSFAEVVSIQEN